jgi:hypothetical protein
MRERVAVALSEKVHSVERGHCRWLRFHLSMLGKFEMGQEKSGRSEKGGLGMCGER